VKVQRERERENTKENTIIRAFSLSLSLSLSVCSSSSLLFVSARSFSLFSLNLIKERMERKMKRKKERVFALCLNHRP
tara:strand:- start:153 stop:386 length:234 start_codon:yes stop_codon:yes gene_type:complete